MVPIMDDTAPDRKRPPSIFEDVPAARRANMARIRGKDTGPELIVRRMLHAMGNRFRLHRRDLPGRPDIVLPGRRKVIFVHGCFWHRHTGCRFATMPTTRRDFWEAKLTGNRARDARNVAALRRAGWSVAVVWECQTRNAAALEARLSRFLATAPPRGAGRSVHPG
jgi:DNA mismatch endonuclease Vsr